MLDREPRIQGMVVEICRREQKTKDNDGLEWERCVFTVALKQYSKGTPDLVLPQDLEGKKVKIRRYCAFDWHYRLNTRKTLSVYETRQILNGKTDLTEV